MKRTLITTDITKYPEQLQGLLSAADIYDSSCSPEARVIFIDKDGGYFLKSAPKGSLEKEAALTEYLYSKKLSPHIVSYISDERDWLLTERARGEDCTHSVYLNDPRRLCDTLALLLRELHETHACGCPVTDRMSAYFELVEQNYKKKAYDLSFYTQDYGRAMADEVFDVVQKNKHLLRNEVLLHGDYCLPNIMLDDWRFSAFIDVGNGGVGNRHVDLYWGAWTLRFNLKTDKYRERFFDAYGRDKIDDELLRTVAASEVFG
ncbi:MAG: aminoglycoside 3'-phosphotransferase [Ruminococcaceae bacterium]|nr:aminoglycoside 3'-phosphotransferase [Oscillospiraceae bacterium]